MLTRAVDTRLPTEFGEFLLRAYTETAGRSTSTSLW